MLETNQIYLGNCLDLMQDIDDNSIDMILCDLPYGTTACSWDTIIPFEPLWKQYKRIIKDNGAIVLTASQPFTSKLVMSNIGMFKYEWIWNKVFPSGFQIAKYRPLLQCEQCLVFGNGKINYNPQFTKREKLKKYKIYGKASKSNPIKYIDGKIRETTNYYPKNLIEFSNANQKGKFHPTQKPVALFEYLIKTYTNENDLVLDNCIGSGTSAIACIRTNRNYIGMEISQEYVDITNKRIGCAIIIGKEIVYLIYACLK